MQLGPFITFTDIAQAGTPLELNRIVRRATNIVCTAGLAQRREQEEMVTNYPHSVASQGNVSASGETHGEGLGERVIDRLRHLVCGLHGHDTLLQFESGRMFLRCVSCGHQTPGWELADVPPTITVAGDARRLAISRPQLITERRIA